MPVTYSSPFPLLDCAQVEALLRESKKPKSVVPGDMFLESVKRNYGALTVPLTNIFNATCVGRAWPSAWKVEYQTCIPKKTCPESVGDLRNISCTNFFSKVLELFVLRTARGFIKLRGNQYGGEPGVSMTHMLVDIWSKITEDLEDNRAVSTVTAIDYSKAFNHLQHLPCLQAMARMNAPTELIALVAWFLHGRRMTVRLGAVQSVLLPVNAGAPQGSVLESLLFNIGTDDLDTVFDPSSALAPRDPETQPDCSSATSSPAPNRNHLLLFNPASPHCMEAR